jgi:hypothetical protein
MHALRCCSADVTCVWIRCRRRVEAEWEGGDIPSANAERLRGEGAGALAGALAAFRRLAGLAA